MSEYQYYEFAAVDRELSEREQDQLREYSTRAEITSTSFVNEYNFGDFRGDPQKILAKYFDAFVYYANWGSRRFMLRLPAGSFDPAVAKPFCAARVLKVRKAGEFIVLDFEAHDESGDFDWEERDWMNTLLPIRDELLRGDLRALYIAWLAGIYSGDIKDDEIEPPVPAGLRKLPARFLRLADFLYLDRELLKIAARFSDATTDVAEPSDAELKKWISKLPVGKKNAYLTRLAQGEGNGLARELKNEFLTAWRVSAKRKPAAQSDAVRRTAGELLAAFESRVDREQSE